MSRHDEQRELSAEEIESQEASELPDREAMTLITTMPTITPVPASGDSTTFLGPPDQATPDPTPTDTPGSTGLGTDAAGSESGTTSTTDDPRSEQIINSDSAASTT